MLTQKRLRQVLDYDPRTGVFTWTKGDKSGEVAGTRHDDRGSLKVSIDNERHLLHRLAWLWMTGFMPRANIEQADGDRSNNRWSNLREGQRMQKAVHRALWRGATGVEGVWSVGSKFVATIAADGIVLNLGEFATAEEARLAIVIRNREARELLARKRQRAA